MTKKQFAQQLLLRTLVAKGTDLSWSELTKEHGERYARYAAHAADLAKAIDDSDPSFFDPEPVRVIT